MSRALGRARSPRSPGWRISKRCARLHGPTPVAANRSRGTGRDCRCPRPGHAHPQCGCTRYSCCAQGVRAEPPHTVTTVVRMQTTHRESPATQVARRQALAFATRGQRDDDADYQTAYQSAHTVVVNGGRGWPIVSLKVGPSHRPTVDGMKEVRGSRLVAPPLRPYSTPARQSRMDDAG
jgi:hypothetical protein